MPIRLLRKYSMIYLARDYIEQDQEQHQLCKIPQGGEMIKGKGT